MIAPISGRACAAYHVCVAELEAFVPRTVIDDEDGQSFLVQDESGVARVQASEFDLAIHADTHLTSGLLVDPPAHVRDWLLAHGQDPTTWLGTNRSLHYDEGVLEQGELVTVLGMVKFEALDDPHAATHGYRQAARRAVLVRPITMSMKISDEPAATGDRSLASG